MNTRSGQEAIMDRTEPNAGTTSVTLWREVELAITVPGSPANPYLDVDLWVDFVHESGRRLRRPAFWDGQDVWRVRFAAPQPGSWTWAWDGTVALGSSATTGTLQAQAGASCGLPFYDHGFWKMSPGRRSLVHADGMPAVLAGDTAWALPWRATVPDVREYAEDRQRKGFNAVLLMSVQPDMGARGPRDRTLDEGFGVGFEDLTEGRLTRPDVTYFQYLDQLLTILVEHGLAPVLSPIFQGFGWKGLGVAGTVVPPAEYARYCRYLVARYGARPLVYLVGADGSGYEPQVAAGGEEVERWDCYQQPTGIHYRPHGHNRAHQNADWLDFQSCQTGHEGQHVAERVTDMWRNTPVKAAMNGEPTYENSEFRGRGTGWWQGHEAWSNLCAGGTLGVVYGAGSLWQWRLHAGEPGHLPYFLAPDAGWHEALSFEGSGYVGLVPKILAGLPTADMEPGWTRSISARTLSLSGDILVMYRDTGGPVRVTDEAVPLHYTVVDPRTGAVVSQGFRSAVLDPIPDPGGAPRVYVCAPEGVYPAAPPAAAPPASSPEEGLPC